ncbi:hypothetical protein I553_1577 [Mycobacterium xenopi 4042]|uniref:Uncharacterized protein n=1 Tax=Mycobacterium xenopi 4042 TaxID=1299334 RepID=X8CGI7_MYCXE|nr:hypothetical protein I553_1577 [Mycobacterium xenopi 4042]
MDWLHPEQRDHFLRMRLVEPVTESGAADGDSPRPPRRRRPPIGHRFACLSVVCCRGVHGVLTHNDRPQWMQSMRPSSRTL